MGVEYTCSLSGITRTGSKGMFSACNLRHPIVESGTKVWKYLESV